MTLKTLSWKFELSRTGHDPFIDFLKGFCIVLVILNHSIPSEVRALIGFPLWGSPAVPIFLILQVFHFYKRGINAGKLDFSKIWKRIVKPFFIVELIILLVWLFSFIVNNGEQPSIKECIYLLTGGPGSYYPWIYLQFAILLPLIKPLFSLNDTLYVFVFVLLSQLLEVICVVFAIPEWIYRLTFFRYMFLICLGYMLASRGYVLNGKTLLIVVVSTASTVWFAYVFAGDIPLTYHVEAWSTCHWICYIYMAYFVMGSLKIIFSCVQNTLFASCLKQIGRNSYEIFIFQLFYFTCVSPFITEILQMGKHLSVYVVLSVILCVVPVLLYQKKKSKWES